jgi:hypothetical protein
MSLEPMQIGAKEAFFLELLRFLPQDVFDSTTTYSVRDGCLDDHILDPALESWLLRLKRSRRQEPDLTGPKIQRRCL